MTKDNQEKLRRMQEGGAKLGLILKELLDRAQPEVSLLTLEEHAVRRIKEMGGVPSFQTVEGYQWATCLCVNEVVVHGVPTPHVLKEGDILTIDVGMLYKGYHTDTAWTKIIQNSIRQLAGKIQNLEQKEEFLRVGEQALQKAIEAAQVGNRVGHISQAIGETIKPAGYGIVKTLVGHGVGKRLHEPPQIPGFLKASVKNTFPLVAGMTLAIEVIYTMGKASVQYLNNDGWSIATKDRSPSAVFEHTVAITEKGPLVLTQRQS